jgi:hypothetical protein
MNIKAEQSSFSAARNALSPVDQSRIEVLSQPLPPKPSVSRNALTSRPDITVTKLPSSGSHLSRYLITNQHGLELGLVEKFRDDRTTINPWKAFLGIGAACRMIGAFYKEDGGYNAAVNAVITG